MAIVCLLATVCANATLKTWDVGDYVQDGLLAHYDGIRNAGADQPHDPNATTWADLSPNSTAGTATRHLGATGHEYGTWKDDAFSMSGWSYFEMGNALTLGLEFTVQIACDLDKSHWKEELGGNNYPCPFGSGEFGAYLDRSYAGIRAKTNLVWKGDAYTNGGSSGNRPNCNWEKGSYFNFAMTSTAMYFTVEAQWPAAYARKVADVSVPALTYTFGGRSGRNGGNCTLGDYHSVRVYSRKLTDEELAWNRMVDEIRFYGADVPVTNVVVAVDPLGRNGTEAAGSYMVDGSHTFAAGTVTVGGNTYQAIAYTVAEWNPSRGFWGEPVMHSGASYEHTVTDGAPKVRLAWVWRLVSGIERLDAWHYVQDGLIANYDGIRNAGAGQPHNPNTTTWTDLARGDVGTLKKTADSTEYGGWSDSSYEFKGFSYFDTGTAIELGNEFTVQCVTDTEMSQFNDNLHSYHTLWAYGEFSIYLDRSYAEAIAATNLVWKDDMYSTGNSSGRAYIKDWDGRYLNAAFDANYSYMSQLTRLETDAPGRNKRARTTPVAVPATKYSWGGRYGTDNRAYRCSKGMYYAWRAYSRKLTDDELAWNRDVDEVRFRDALPTFMSNAVVVVSANGAFSAAEDGTYALGGSYTFTAEQKNLDGRIYSPCYMVQTWDGNTKEWVETARSTGGACTLNEADGTAPRRIVWSWHKEGFSITIR